MTQQTHQQNRQQRKELHEFELFKIKLEELALAVLEPGSWFQQNVRYKPDMAGFWDVMPKYLLDCHRPPSHLSHAQIQLAVYSAVHVGKYEYEQAEAKTTG